MSIDDARLFDWRELIERRDITDDAIGLVESKNSQKYLG